MKHTISPQRGLICFVAYSAFVGLFSGGLFEAGKLTVEHLDSKINSKSETNSRKKGTDEFTEKYLGETGKDYFEGIKDLDSLREKLRVLSNSESNANGIILISIRNITKNSSKKCIYQTFFSNLFYISN